jgi:hypothetical protein
MAPLSCAEAPNKRSVSTTFPPHLWNQEYTTTRVKKGTQKHNTSQVCQAAQPHSASLTDRGMVQRNMVGTPKTQHLTLQQSATAHPGEATVLCKSVHAWRAAPPRPTASQLQPLNCVRLQASRGAPHKQRGRRVGWPLCGVSWSVLLMRADREQCVPCYAHAAHDDNLCSA